MGEGEKAPLRVGFDRGIKLEFHGAKITSDASLLVYRELDDAFDLTATAANELVNIRTGNNTRRPHSSLGYRPPAPETVLVDPSASAALQPLDPPTSQSLTVLT
jgi:transposase InsO family protein